jgi:hypothetical protein
MTPQEFIAKWQPVKLTERSACQQHFLDLCDVLGQPKPARTPAPMLCLAANFLRNAESCIL